MTREKAIEIMSRPFSMSDAPAEIIEAHEMAIKALKEQRPHGTWVDVPKYKGFYVCSKCLERLDGDFERFDHWEMKKDNFCSVCGSDNRKIGEEQ